VRILVLHRRPDDLIHYRDSIDHEAHEVIYVSAPDRLSTLPKNVRCQVLERPGVGDTATEVLAAIADVPKPDMVLAVSEFDMIAAGEVREALSVPGPKVSDALLVRDKVAMKSAVAAAGVRVPRFLPLVDATDPSQVPWTGATVLKPSRGAGSQGIVVLQTVAATIAAARDVVSPDEIADFEIEEYLPGRVVHIDGLVSGGRAVALQPSRYINTPLEYLGGAPFGGAQFGADEALVEWTLRCLAAVGIAEGSFHLEAIEAADQLAFMEVAARWAAGPIVDAFELATGVWLPSAAVQVTVNGPSGLPPVRSPGPAEQYGWFLIPGHKLGSQFCQITGEREFRDHPLIRSWQQRTAEEPVRYSYAMEDVPVAGVVGPASGPELEEFIHRVFAAIEVTPAPAADPRP
jgi:biotin carboxylase